jgi:hypothetical protein
MNATESKTCADRIAARMTSREQRLTDLFDKVNSTDDEQQDAQEELDNFALAVTTQVLLRIDISTGGPADYLTAVCWRGQYGALEVQSVTYHFADWFDHAETPVASDSPLYAYAEQMAELYAEASE